MRKILYVATSDIHLHAFHRPYLRFLSDRGYEVHIAVEDRGGFAFDEVHRYHRIVFRRSGLDGAHLAALKRLTGLMRANRYALVHCHTPIPSVLARLANLFVGKARTTMLYTAHGFHFYKGGPRSYWMTYFPVEWALSMVTDGLVTINREDFEHASNKLRCRKVYQIPGIGLDLARFRPLAGDRRADVKAELGLAPDAFVLLYVAEFIPRKNHEFLLDAMPSLAAEIPELQLVLAGQGVLMERMRSKVKQLGLEEQVSFTGFTDRVPAYAAVSDLAVSTSRHEGLGLGLAEQMACQVPVVASEDKGHRELVDHGINGYLYRQGDSQHFVDCVLDLYRHAERRANFGLQAREKSRQFGIDQSLARMEQIYREFIDVDSPEDKA
ncbi:MAG: glycosyltransferase [Wenzhouxiangella sp.]|nr:glycosyltransferase [Wenzhouxiangella sp.]